MGRQSAGASVARLHRHWAEVALRRWRRHLRVTRKIRGGVFAGRLVALALASVRLPFAAPWCGLHSPLAATTAAATANATAASSTAAAATTAATTAFTSPQLQLPPRNASLTAARSAPRLPLAKPYTCHASANADDGCGPCATLQHCHTPKFNRSAAGQGVAYFALASTSWARWLGERYAARLMRPVAAQLVYAAQVAHEAGSAS